MRSVIILAAITVACGASGGASDSGRLGSEGDSCLRTADCEAPLRCVGNVCRDGDVTSQGADTEIGFEAPDSGVLLAGADVGELPPVDVADTSPPSPDAVAELLTDILGEDGLATTDIGPPPELPPVGDGSVFSECETVGIAPSWAGTFAGFISYEVPFEIPGANSSDSLPVEGTLAFEVACIEKKLIVVGDMDGLALDQYPFSLHLTGGYNPDTAELNVKMKDGSVALFDFGTGTINVLFEGTLTGSLQNDLFEGIWQGEAVGTDPPGIPGTATGLGSWNASPQ